VAKVPTECVIGVDLGGTNLKAALVDETLTERARVERVIAGLGREELLAALAQAVAQLRESAEGEVEAVGLGIAGLIDSDSGVVASSTHLPIVGLAIADVLSERVGLTVLADNDANVALLAEVREGAAAGERVALIVALGTGVGGAIAFDGEIYRGARGAAGEFGHIVLSPDGPACGPGCRSRGCLEALVSGSALHRDAAAAGLPADGALVTELALAGDATALALLGSLGEWLGLGLLSLANAFGPDVIVVGGGVSGAGELILEPARTIVRERAPELIREVEIRRARFGAHAGMLGAAILAREHAAVSALAGRPKGGRWPDA
jgi:glucokinase